MHGEKLKTHVPEFTVIDAPLFNSQPELDGTRSEIFVMLNFARKEVIIGGGYKGPDFACPSGYHYAKDGSGRLVRNRRMNPANPRALRRAVRRMDGFEKLARRVLKNTHTIRRKR